MPVDKPVYDIAPASSSNADLIKKLIDQYTSASSITFWLLGSACLIAGYLFIQNFSKENVYFPFFIVNKNNTLEMTLTASKSAILQSYNYFGVNKITFNDLLKVFVLLFIFVTLIKTLLILVFKFFATLFPIIKKPFILIGKLIPSAYEEKSWLAEPISLGTINAQGHEIYPQLRRRIPVEITNFRYIRFNIHVLGDNPHWRAGIFINSFDRTKDYVFHVYKNKDDSRIMTKMTKRNFMLGRHVDESDKEITGIDIKNFQFELKADNNHSYSLIINGTEVDRYTVPKEDFKFIEIGAWADDKPYKIEFTDIDFLG